MSARALRGAIAVWRRELQITLRAPVLYVIGGVFLAVQGVAFAGLVTALSDPRRPGPLGALLEGQLAGTLLTWVLQLVVITLLGMRTIAEDKRGGAWELLLTAQIGEGAAVVGKWLAAVTVYALLWIPTLLYLAVVGIFRVDPGGWDLASIATGYLGAIAIGAGLLAWTIAASAATSTTLVAGAFGFALLIGLFLLGELPVLFGDLTTAHPSLAHALGVLSLRGQLTTLARGEVTASGVVFVLGLALTGLSLAFALACAGRRRAHEVRLRAASTVLVAAISILATALATERPASWDVSAARRNSLDPVTRSVLDGLPGRATVTIIEPTLGALEPIYTEVERVARRMAHAGSLEVRRVDPASLPGGLEAAARIAGIEPGDLASNGGVVVELGGKRRVVDRVQLASIDRDDAGMAAIERLAIERSLAGALAQLTGTVPVSACATTGHGELPIAAEPQQADWSLVAERLRGEGIDLDTVEIAAGVPPRCNVVIVAGPTMPLSPEEAFALQAFVQHGGGLLVAAASRPITGGASTLAKTGLEGLLANEGLGLPEAIAVDPSLAVREMPGALLVVDTYSTHEINAGFAGARPTVWFQPRAVVAAKGATPLVRASETSWGETDLLHAPPEKGPTDLSGAIVLAALGSQPVHRVLALGSAESFTTAVLSGSASAGDLWLENAIRFLAGKPPPKLAIAARPAEQVRLVMTESQRRTVVVLCVAGIPLAWILAGALLLLIRRRAT